MTRRHGHDRPADKGMTQRQRRVGEMLRHALVEVLARGHVRDRELQDKAVTVTEVSVTADLRHATVYCTALGGEGDAAVVAALNRARAYLRGELGRAIRLKFTPDLVFEIDASFAEAEAVDALLRSPKVARDLAKQEAPDDDG